VSAAVARLLTTSDAKIFRTSYSKVPLAELLNTRTFDFAKAATGAGWLQSLRDAGDWTDANGVTKKIPKPETEE
jgi:G3E family GTPase